MSTILELIRARTSGYSDEVTDYSDESADSGDEEFMRAALDLADHAEAAGEVPVGAVIVIDGRIVGRGYNCPVSTHDPTAHAEVLALREAAESAGNYRLSGSTLYVTLEPCPMCAGAMVHARVGRLVFGARDLRFGAVRSKFRLADSELLNHRMEVVEGVCAAECLERLQRFFSRRRE
jgi:tRNA(adenine34) deaminase